MSRKILTAILLLLATALVSAPQVNTFCAANLSCTVSGAWTYSSQLVSSMATGTAPFSIASTTQVANLNAQLHGGFSAPASAILGLTDAQAPTNKTINVGSNSIVQTTPSAGKYLRDNGTSFQPSSVAAAGAGSCSGVQFPQTLNDNATPTCVTPATFVASGGSHAVGYVPDPGSSAGTTRFLREDATFAVPLVSGYKIECINTTPVTVTNTASETVLMTCSIPANELGNNQTLRIHASGTNVTSATQTLTMRVRIGGLAGTVLGASDVAIANSSGGAWNLNFTVTANGAPSGSTATECQGMFVENNGTTTPLGTTLSNSATVSWATNSTLSLVITQAWSAAVTATFTERELIVERLN